MTDLLVVSHVSHYLWQGDLFAYGPYVHEIDIWADLFSEIVISAPCRRESPTRDAAAFTRQNIRIVPQSETGGITRIAKLRQIVMLPALIFTLCRAMAQADAIHVRCPGNLGLLGAILAPLFSKKIIAKYAGQWTGYPGEPWTFRLQRALLRSRWWRGPVTVYGEWPDQPPHAVPFFTSILRESHMIRAQAVSGNHKSRSQFSILYVGRLSRAKNVHILLSAVNDLILLGENVTLSIVGDGPQHQVLDQRIVTLGIQESVSLVGSVPFDEVLQYYENADVLVLISESEGWPKAIAEGMAFGLICIGSDRGLVPQMLAEARGIVVPAGDEGALLDALKQILDNPEEFHAMRASAAEWAQQFTLEGLRQAISDLLAREWGIELPYSEIVVEERSV
jgi:glycosyltransferase involved in cell wall biosynthesis